MATYLQGTIDYLPQVQPFQPDYNFLGNILQTRQSRYDAAHKQLSSVYGTMLNSPMLRDSNIKNRGEFFKSIDQDIQRMSGMDLSLQQNVDSALNVFKGLYEDKNIVKDMVWTKNYMNQKEVSDGFRRCTDADKCGGQWWEGGDQYLDYKAQEFKNATDQEALSFQDVNYIAAQPIMERAMKLAKDSGFNIKWDVDKGDWIVSHKNGQEMIKPLSEFFMATFGSDPKIMAYKKAQAYVTRKGWVNQNLSQYGSEDEANIAYINNMYQNTQALITGNKKVAEEAKTVVDGEMSLLEKQIRESGYFDNEAFREGYDALRSEQEILNTSSEVYRQAEDAMKAYGLNKDNLKASLEYFDNIVGYGMLTNEATTAASAYANLTAEQELKENPYAKMAKEHAFQASQFDKAHGTWEIDPQTRQKVYVPGILAMEAAYTEEQKNASKKQADARKSWLSGTAGEGTTALKPDLEAGWDLANIATDVGRTILNNMIEQSKLLKELNQDAVSSSISFSQKIAGLLNSTGTSDTLRKEITTLLSKLTVVDSEKKFKETQPYREAIKALKNGDETKLVSLLTKNTKYARMFINTLNSYIGTNATSFDKVRFKGLFQELGGTVIDHENNIATEKQAYNRIKWLNEKNAKAALVNYKAEMDQHGGFGHGYLEKIGFDGAIDISDYRITKEGHVKMYGKTMPLSEIDFFTTQDLANDLLDNISLTNNAGYVKGTSNSGSIDISSTISDETNKELKAWAKKNSKYFVPRDYTEVEYREGRVIPTGFMGGMTTPSRKKIETHYSHSAEDEAYDFAVKAYRNATRNMIYHINYGQNKDIKDVRSMVGGTSSGLMAAPYSGSFSAEQPDALVDEAVRNFNINKNNSNLKVVFAGQDEGEGIPKESNDKAKEVLSRYFEAYINGPAKGKSAIYGDIKISSIPSGVEGYTAFTIQPSGSWISENTQIPQAKNRLMNETTGEILKDGGIRVYIKDTDWEGDFTRKTQLSPEDIILRTGGKITRKSLGGELTMEVIDGQNHVKIGKKYFDPESNEVETESRSYILNQDLFVPDFLEVYDKELAAQGQLVYADLYEAMSRYGKRVLPGQQ